MDREIKGFQEIEHTADWELEVWAPDLSQLFEQAALGMYAICGIKLQGGRRQTRRLEIQAADLESLMVSYLSELLYLVEKDRLAFDKISIELEDHTLRGRLQGSTILSLDKEIKAATYHQMEVRKSSQGYHVNIVFDV